MWIWFDWSYSVCLPSFVLLNLFFKVSDTQSSPSSAELCPLESLNCDKAAQCENHQREPEEQQEEAASSPQMNVIVKEEEEEEPLCGTNSFSYSQLKAIIHLMMIFNCNTLFPSVEEAPEQMSGSEDCTMTEETEDEEEGEQQEEEEDEDEEDEEDEEEESGTDLRITVKEEEEPDNSENITLQDWKCYSAPVSVFTTVMNWDLVPSNDPSRFLASLEFKFSLFSLISLFLYTVYYGKLLFFSFCDLLSVGPDKAGK